MVRTKKVTRIWPTMDVVAAACAAQRVNGTYIKVPYQLGDENKRQTNRELVYQFLEDESFVTDADRLLAEDIKEYFKGYTFKVLSGAYLSEFDRTTMKILEELIDQLTVSLTRISITQLILNLDICIIDTLGSTCRSNYIKCWPNASNFFGASHFTSPCR